MPESEVNSLTQCYDSFVCRAATQGWGALLKGGGRHLLTYSLSHRQL